MLSHFEDDEIIVDEGAKLMLATSQNAVAMESPVYPDYPDSITPKAELCCSITDTHRDITRLKDIGFDIGITRTWQDVIPGMSTSR